MISEEHQAINSDTPLLGDTTKTKVRDAIFRYFVLFLICLMTFGSYYVYDLPGALQDNLMEWYGIDATKYEAFYMVYSWPNTVFAFCGGFLVDRVFGTRIGSILFAALVTAGQVVFAMGISTKSYWLAIAGRFIFGLGGECLAVAQSTYTAKWFSGKELALAFAITISFSRVGSAVNFNISPRLDSFTFAFWLGALLCGISLANCFLLALIDKRRENKRIVDHSSSKEVETIRFKDILHFPLNVWAIYAIVVSFYVAVFIYITVGKSVIMENWPDINGQQAGTILGLPYTISSAASPICGLLVDLVGRKLIWMIGATGALTAVHASIAFLRISIYVPWVAHVVMGLAYSALAASLWPSIAVLLPSHMLGSGYGLAFSLQNLGLALFPLLVGQIHAWTGNFSDTVYAFLGCAGLSCLLVVVLLIWDLRDPKLNLSGAEIRRRAKDENGEDNLEGTW